MPLLLPCPALPCSWAREPAVWAEPAALGAGHALCNGGAVWSGPAHLPAAHAARRVAGGAAPLLRRLHHPANHLEGWVAAGAAPGVCLAMLPLFLHVAQAPRVCLQVTQLHPTPLFVLLSLQRASAPSSSRTSPPSRAPAAGSSTATWRRQHARRREWCLTAPERWPPRQSSTAIACSSGLCSAL